MRNPVEMKRKGGSAILNAKDYERTMKIGNLGTFEQDTSLDFPNRYLLEALYTMTGYLQYISDTRENLPTAL